MTYRNLLLVLISSIISIIFFEILLLLFWANPYKESSTDKVIKLGIAHSNINQIFDRSFIDKENPTVLYRTDQRGYIMASPQHSNPDYTIAFLGGSTTECMLVSEDLRFPAAVGVDLNKKGIKVNVINAARSGGTLHESINILLNHLIIDKPNYIILMHATNDIGVLKVDRDYRSRLPSSVSLGHIAKYLLQIGSTKSSLLGKIRQLYSYDSGLNINEINYNQLQVKDSSPFKSRLISFINICQAFDIVPIIMTQPLAGNIQNKMTPSWADTNAQGEFNQIIRDICSETGTNLIDLESSIASSVKNREDILKIFYDGMHVTDYGSLEYAKYISKYLYSLLSRD